jgi:alanine racemase
VTDIDVSEEDEVMVYPDIKLAAKSIGTIPYELLTSISQRVKRVYFYE